MCGEEGCEDYPPCTEGHGYEELNSLASKEPESELDVEATGRDTALSSGENFIIRCKKWKGGCPAKRLKRRPQRPAECNLKATNKTSGLPGRNRHSQVQHH